MQSDIVILGAGCSGMTLAAQLNLQQFPGTVAIIDQRLDFSREQRWCSWGPVTMPVENVISHQWNRFRICGNGDVKTAATPNSPYIHIYAPTYFAEICTKLAFNPRITLALDHTVTQVDRHDANDVWTITTSKGKFASTTIIDARNLESALDKSQNNTEWIWQSFAGQQLEFSRDLFDPEELTLMDFDITDGDQGAFVYVLPFSRRSAIIESTLVSKRIGTEFEHMSAVNQYAERLDSMVKSKGGIEYGMIPMTTARMPLKRDKNHYAIGVSGGAAKPSTGYAFARIQEQCAKLARQLTGETTKLTDEPSADELRRKWLDEVFITAASQNSRFFTSTILKMTRKLPTDVIVRFLSERSTALDDLQVMAAVGSPELIKAALSLSSSRRMKAQSRTKV